MFNLYADVDARSMTPSRNTRSYTLRSVPSSPGRSFLLLVSYLSVWVAHDEGLLLPCLLFLCFLALDDNLALFVVDIFKASGDVLKLR